MGEGIAPDQNQVQPQADAQADPLRPQTVDELSQKLDSELTKPDADLAIQGIDGQIADVAHQRRSVGESISFTRGYRPRHPGPSPHPEDGGMDHEDYRTAEWEYNNYDSQDELDGLAEQDVRLYEAIDELEELRKRVKSGDATLIEKFSLAEKTRLEAEFRQKVWNAERRVFDYDTWRGVELIGTRELLTTLEGLLGSVGVDGQPKNSEWVHSHWATREDDKVALRYSHDTFTHSQDGTTVSIQVGAKAVPSNGAYYAPPNPDEYDGYLVERLSRLVEVTVDTPDYKHEGGFVHRGQKHAEYLGFHLYDDGRIAEQEKWKNGFRSVSQIPNIIIGTEDIDRIQGYVNGINAGEQNEDQ